MIEITEEFACSPIPLYVILSDFDRWPVGSIARVLTTREPETVIASFPDFSRVTITISGAVTGALVTIKHELISDAAQLKAHNKFWANYLKQIRGAVER